VPFPEVLKRLAEAGVESYYADLNQLQKFYYAPCGETFVARLKTQPLGTATEQFDANAVKQALQDIRKRKSAMRNFCNRLWRRERSLTQCIFAGGALFILAGPAIFTSNIFHRHHRNNDCFITKHKSLTRLL
jgi:uncharacterized protein YbcV (DUF1398 family)